MHYDLWPPTNRKWAIFTRLKKIEKRKSQESQILEAWNLMIKYSVSNLWDYDSFYNFMALKSYSTVKIPLETPEN